jgi:hypothetical protein
MRAILYVFMYGMYVRTEFVELCVYVHDFSVASTVSLLQKKTCLAVFVQYNKA